MSLTSFSDNNMRILVIKLRHHGDILLITPVIHTLRNAYPQATIDVLLYAETRPMLACHPDVERIYTIDRRCKKRGLCYQIRQEWQLLCTLRQQKYQLVVNLADQWRSAIVTRFTAAPCRLGFDFAKRRHRLWKVCHTCLAETDSHAALHIVEQNLTLLTSLRLPEIQRHTRMHYSTDDEAQVKSILGDITNYIVVQPTARWFFKCWDDKKFAATLQTLLDEGHAIVITSGPDSDEIAMVADILQQLTTTERLISLAGKLTLTQLAAIIDHAKLFIGVDSVPVHMAAALRTPSVALYGPSKLIFWHPWQFNGEVIWAGDYGPLPEPDEVKTNTHERYLDAIPVGAVLAAVHRQLSGNALPGTYNGVNKGNKRCVY